MVILLSSADMRCVLRSIDDGGNEHIADWDAGRELSKDLHSHLLDLCGGDLRQIGGIGVHAGPGSFTGLRIGLTVANTLAESLGVPIVGATGDDWMHRVRLRLDAGENDQIVMPVYGADAHITTQKK